MNSPLKHQLYLYSRNSKCSTAIAILIACLSSPFCLNAQTGTQAPPSQPGRAPQPLAKRVIKVFDFNERPLGNLEDRPMYWQKVTLSGFPHYVNGHLDEQVGNPAPSFCLELNGGNLGYLYTVRQIPAFPGSDHKIYVTFKTKNLRYARGYIQAFYMDRYSHLLEDTITYSPLITPARPNDPEWRTLSMELPFTNPEGRFIGIGVFLVQQDRLPEFYHSPVKSLRKDIDAKIWLDDILVLRLPKARLKLNQDLPLYSDTDEITVSATVADSIPTDLSANLIFTDLSHNQTRIFPHPVATLPPLEAILQGNANPPQLIPHQLGKFQPGLYRLTLQVRTASETIIEKSINIAVLNHDRPVSETKDFGVDLTSESLDNPKRIAGFLNALAPRWISLSLWRKDFAVSRSSMDLSPADNLIMELNTRKIRIIGAYPEVPEYLVNQTDLLNPSIWDFLAGKPTWWESEFALILSRHADRIDQWVFGRAGDITLSPDPRIIPVLKKIRTEFNQYQGQFSLLTAWPAMIAPPTQSQADGYFLKVPLQLIPTGYENYFKPWLKGSAPQTCHNLWAVLEAQNLNEVKRNPSTIDFVKRFIEAKRCGVPYLAAENLWSADPSVTAGNYEPTAYFVAYANLIDRLSGTDYLGKVQIDDDHTGSFFASPNRAVLILQGTGQQPYTGSLSLGDQIRAYDFWGRSLPIQSTDSGWEIPCSPLVFIDGIAPDLARFIASVKFDPETIPGKFGPQDLRLTFQNTFNQSVNGTVRLLATQSWLFDPSGSRFALMPDQEFSQPMKLRYPTNEPLGRKSIGVRFELEAQKPITLNLVLPLYLGSSEVQMKVLWFLRGKELIVWQEITNNTQGIIDLIAFTIAPNQPRLERQVNQLGPGQTATKEYSLGLWKDMFGQTIRVGYREIRGNRIGNEVIKLE